MSISKRKILLVLFGITAFVGISLYAASYQETGPVYSLEGAWYGMVTITSPVTINSPSLDTFTSNAQRHGIEGTFLCTIPPFPNSTASGHGNWVRIGTNTYAYTAVRTVFNPDGSLKGRAKFWGTITPISENEYTGTMNSQNYLPDGTPFSPLFTGTLHSKRVEIIFEQ